MGSFGHWRGSKMERHQFLTMDEMMGFALAGKAKFTLVSKATGTRFTFRVSEAPDGTAWFVSLLTGPDNEADFAYIGLIRDGQFRWTKKSRVSQDAPSWRAFSWFFLMVTQGNEEALLRGIEFWHEGQCCRCGRTLTVPESIASGIGPECARKAGRDPRVLTQDALERMLNAA